MGHEFHKGKTAATLLFSRKQLDFIWMVAFYGNDTPFSNFWRTSFEKDGEIFSSSEQAFMYAKALRFGDLGAAERILQTEAPAEAKRIGRQVKGFREDIWSAEAPKAMYDILYAKFLQDEECKQTLKASCWGLLVEASPRDTLWGVGYAINNPKVYQPSEWRGKNQLGLILTELRIDIFGC